MIVTEIYNGQGLGNQLACYITTRALALKMGYDFGIKSPEKFKCLDFMNLDFGLSVIGGLSPAEGAPPHQLPQGIKHYFRERDIRHPNGTDIRTEDPLLLSILDNTKIDGILQNEKLWFQYKDEIKQWLRVNDNKDNYTFSDDNICVINFRGGNEYPNYPELYLTQTYWDNAVNKMLEINSNFKFVVITDDIVRAKGFFPNFDTHHFDIGNDYSIIKNAKYLILSNSSFSYFPTFTSDTIKYIIAPKYNARHNVSDGYWAVSYNIYQNYNYLDRDNKLFTYQECIDEYEMYKINNKHLFNI